MHSCCCVNAVVRTSLPCCAVRATTHIALLVSSPQQLALVQQQTRWRGPLMKAFMVSSSWLQLAGLGR